MKLLKDNGYKKYKTEGKDDVTYPYSDCFYQKKFIDKIGIKYFVQFVYYSPSLDRDYYGSLMLDMVTNEPFYTFRKHHIELETQANLEKLEKECELFFITFKCKYYELYS